MTFDTDVGLHVSSIIAAQLSESAKGAIGLKPIIINLNICLK